MKNFRKIAGVIVCSNFGKKTRQFICCFLDVQDSHNPHSYPYHSLSRYLQNHLLINLVTQQVFALQSRTGNEILLRDFQCKSKLIVYSSLIRIISLPLKILVTVFFLVVFNNLLCSALHPDIDLTCITQGGPWSFILQTVPHSITKFSPLRLI